MSAGFEAENKKGQRGALAQLLPPWVDEMFVVSARWAKNPRVVSVKIDAIKAYWSIDYS